MNRLIILMLAAAAVLAVSGCISGDTGPVVNQTCPAESQVQQGDLVKVEYRGTLEDGTVFDEGMIDFVSSVGQMIEGFDEAVLGMCLGEEKNAVIPPEKGYPYYQGLVVNIPLIVEMNRSFEVTAESFTDEFNVTPVTGNTYKSEDMMFPVKVTGISGDNVSMEWPVGVGYTVNATEGRPWELVVISANETSIMVMHNLTDGSVVDTYMGQRTVHMIDGNITIDLNREIAGRTLYFYIKVLEIEKQ
jgi:FKBP-type peptidyl-prolyl cis-trans isomerase 2